MAGRQQNEGYNLIQYPEISSSSDVFNPSFNFRYISNLPSGRRTYRQSRYYHLSQSHNEVIVPEHSLPRPMIPSIPPTREIIENFSTKTALISVGCIFVCSLLALSLVYAKFPQLSDEERPHIRIPWNMEQAKRLGIILDRYKDDNYLQVMGGVFVTYIFLQTFAIPGSLFLSILSGFLFPFSVALILVCTCSALGASLCFLISQLLGRKLVLKYFPERAYKWAVIVNKQRDNLFNYVIFLRITPFLPNWFINLTAPVIGVPLKPFAVGTFFGVAPPSFVAIQAGQTLHTMSSTDSTFSWISILLLGIFAIVSLIPIFLKQKLREKFD